MRGGAALLGEASPVTLLERWTGSGAQLLVGEYDGVVVGLLAATTGDAVAGRVSGRIECCYVEPGRAAWASARPSWKPGWSGAAPGAAPKSTPWRCRGTAPPSNAWRRLALPPAC